ncbi:unnamed protein product [Clonostachys byssicola]|uniref:Dienelactone hydrolase domain-containing protein n=1 Tax=Clonostachys byssicola TaxID=160290 RepID=A0A9N9UBP6_9HYPO|nr:unnamed protein product [Clonostachys byssicola]
MAKIRSFYDLLVMLSLLTSQTLAKCPVASVCAIAHKGPSIGKEVVHENMTLYVTGKHSNTAVLYLTDATGIVQPENRLLADSFGRAGYLTVAPDLFNGTPAPAAKDPYNPNYNQTEFLARHNPKVIDPMIDATIRYIRNVLGINRIVASGYCFGGRHAVRVLSEGRGVSASFAAHPALLQDDEILGITGPVTIAAAENDFAMSIDQRRHIEDLLLNTTHPYSLSLYSGTEHGFGVRGNVSIPQIKFAKEEAYFQAVRWFDSWGKAASGGKMEK